MFLWVVIECSVLCLCVRVVCVWLNCDRIQHDVGEGFGVVVCRAVLCCVASCHVVSCCVLSCPVLFGSVASHCALWLCVVLLRIVLFQ